MKLTRAEVEFLLEQAEHYAPVHSVTTPLDALGTIARKLIKTPYGWTCWCGYEEGDEEHSLDCPVMIAESVKLEVS